MKNIITIAAIAILLIPLSFFNSYSQDSNHVLMEICTGTWCGYCPCGKTILNDQIMTYYPNTVPIYYHGGSGNPPDPFVSYSSGMIALHGFSSYPQATIGRITGKISRGSWLSQVAYQNTFAPGVKIEFNNATYNPVTRLLSADILITALKNDSGSFYFNIMLTEDRLIAPQNCYSACGYNGVIYDYIHDHVLINTINGTTGQTLTATGYTVNETFNKQLSYTLPQSSSDANSQIVVFVYKYGGSLYHTQCPVQNAAKKNVNSFTPTSIINNELGADKYYLSQNYPNPFNPSTSIQFSIPKAEHVTLKIYDVKGSEVVTQCNQFLQAGIYNAKFDGSRLPSGIYLYKLTAGSFSETKKMLLVK